MGREFLDDALAVDIEREGVRVTGFAGLPTLHRPDPGQQYLFVNGRPVKDRLLIGAVRAAYGDLLPRGAIPCWRCSWIFPARGRRQRASEQSRGALPRRGRACAALVAGALRAALDAAGHRATATGGSHALDALVCAQTAPAAPPTAGRGSTYTPAAQRVPSCGLRRGLAGPARRPGRGRRIPERRRARLRRAAARGPADRPLGAARAQLHETYIVAQTRTSVVIVDQHAAHERLVYERLKAALANGGVVRQGLLIPEIVELEPDEVEALVERADELGRLGLVVEAFGPGAVLVREVPALLGDTDVKGLVRDLAREALAERQGSLLEERLAAVCAHHGLPRQRARRAPARRRAR